MLTLGEGASMIPLRRDTIDLLTMRVTDVPDDVEMSP